LLAALGLDADTEAVYRLMAAHGDGWDIERIARQLDIDHWRVRACLDRLAELTLLRESHAAPGAWRAVSPAIGLQTLLRRQEDELQKRQRELAATHLAVGQLLEDLPLTADQAHSQRLIGIDAVQAKLEEFAEQATESVATFMPGGSHSPAAIEAATRNDAKILGRGVHVRTLCLDSVRNHPPTLGYARTLNDSGGEVRTTPALPMRMILVDGVTALVPLDTADTRSGAVVIQLTGALAALTALFELAWNTALPLGTERSRSDSTGVTPSERELLRLLAQGITDEAAGSRMGVSLSTVRRTMSSLMERLGARSRFEAGLRAAQQGWL
jgi:DNA-binding CsgD family transcriptional regulator/predicted ArsR family transcriptional regulator